jgi:hypothetical protein
MNGAAVLIVVIVNPLTVLACVSLGFWAARTGVLTIRRPPRRPAPKEPPA